MQSDSVYHNIMCSCRVTVCIITLCANAEWQCISLHYMHMQWQCISLHYVHMQSDGTLSLHYVHIECDDIYHYIMCTCRVTAHIIVMCTHKVMAHTITLCAHAEWQCVSLHYVHMQSDGAYHYVMCTCRVTARIITLCAHAEWRCVFKHANLQKQFFLITFNAPSDHTMQESHCEANVMEENSRSHSGSVSWNQAVVPFNTDIWAT